MENSKEKTFVGDFIVLCFVLSQGLTRYPKLASDSQSSCLSLSSTGITDMYEHTS